jgi:hypothetical protein
MKCARKVQLIKSKAIEKKTETHEPPNLRSSKDEKPSKGGKAENSKDKATTAKGNTKHSEVNGVTSNAKLKNNLSLKRKLSTA